MKYAYWLDNIPELSKAKIRLLYEEVSSAEEIYYMLPGQLKRIEGITEEDVRVILKAKRGWDLDQRWFSLMEKGIGFVASEHSDYPEKLKYILNPPYALYYVGKLPKANQKSVAIVGARGRSAYGSEMTNYLAKVLAEHGVQVISGLAKGIDGDAHKGALAGGGETFAVLGCGVDVCYPTGHKYLYEKIIQNGGIISEYPPQTQPAPWQFPARNRIISGLSDCVVVMEAKEKSGSLITADFAMEQGKDVYALPGRVTDVLSQGCNKLIKQGAGIVESVEDFLADLDILTEMSGKQIDFRKNLLEKDELLVYSLTDFRPISVADLMEKTKMPIFRLLEIIERLKSMGLIKETFTNYFVRTILD
ncbi:MAG: DNA-processing protein DprA [Agathobacter sp.]|nr:DNA-processing protein DprA [Agathobacter sp.]